MTKCSQCDRAAMFQVNGHPLCVEHHEMVQRGQRQDAAAAAAYLNYLKDEMSETAGLLPLGTAKLGIPQPTLHTGPKTYNSVHVAPNAVVGAINTGTVERLAVSIENVRTGSDPAVAEALAKLTVAVVGDAKVGGKERNEILEHLEFLAAQAEAPKEQRKHGVGRSIATALGTALSVSADLTGLWVTFGPKIIELFN